MLTDKKVSLISLKAPMVFTRSQRLIFGFGVCVNELTVSVGSSARAFTIKKCDLHLELLMA